MPMNDTINVHNNEDCFGRTNIWVKTSKNEFAAQLVPNGFKTIPDFFEGIKDALVAQNKASTDDIMAKGRIQKVKIACWNTGNVIKNPLTFEVTTPRNIFTKFHDDLAYVFTEYLEPSYGEEILCFATVLFEKDE
jgi:hypothetical protein